jgi:hypothetical protein
MEKIRVLNEYTTVHVLRLGVKEVDNVLLEAIIRFSNFRRHGVPVVGRRNESRDEFCMNFLF